YSKVILRIQIPINRSPLALTAPSSLILIVSQGLGIPTKAARYRLSLPLLPSFPLFVLFSCCSFSFLVRFGYEGLLDSSPAISFVEVLRSFDLYRRDAPISGLPILDRVLRFVFLVELVDLSIPTDKIMRRPTFGR
ncbi:hypothetical protein MUK42_12335, partial [Musa troglodytarum]